MSGCRFDLVKFLKDWMLIIGMLVGAGAYLLYHGSPFHWAGPYLLGFCKFIQPVLLFMMLFLSFCKIEPHQMRPHKWMLSLLLVQGLLFALFSVVILASSRFGGLFQELVDKYRIGIESAMLCLICPTATACAVVTGKLGGNMAGVVTYTILINILTAFEVPLFVPLLYPSSLSFGVAFSKILAKVFPLLIMPCILAWIVRYLLPGLHSRLVRYTNLSFYIWAVSLALAIAMSTRAIVYSNGSLSDIMQIAVSSLLCCIFQFAVGKRIGSAHGCRISSGQALGQKNTVFAIWMGYTFMNPIVSVAGGFYSIWHNVFNTWQLYRKRKEGMQGK